MLVSIIIVNFNTRKFLSNCLESINKSTINHQVEIIVIDNGSKDGSVKMIKSEFPSIKLIVNNYNTGFGHANNQGIRIAQGEYLLFLNSDTKIIDGFFEKLSEEINKLKNPGAIGFKIKNLYGSLQTFCGNFPNLLNLFMEAIYLDRLFKGSSRLFYRILNHDFYEKQQRIDWVSGSCFLVKRNVIQKIGGFDEKYFLYGEDVDLAYQIKRAGYKNFYLPIDSVIHLNRASTDDKTPAIIFSHHNLIYFFKKNYSKTQALLLDILFIIKSFFYFIIGSIISIVFQKYWNRTKSYFFLLITLILKKKFTQYENSFKQQN